MRRFNQLNKFGFGLRPLFAIDDPDGGGGGGNDPPSDPPSDPPPSDPPPSDPPADPPSNYFQAVPEDWRSQALTSMGLEEGTDDFTKRLSQMERVSDFSVFGKNYFEAQDKIRAGEVSTGLPAEPTDEQLAAYREANGIPGAADAYELALDQGLVLGDADKESMKGVFEAAFGGNVTSETMSNIVNAHLTYEQSRVETMMAQDGLDEQAATQQLKETWGGDYERNKNMSNALIAQLPATLQDEFKNARLASGKALLNSPEMLVAMANWMSTFVPAALVVPGSTNPMKTIVDEIKSFKTRMSEDSEGWHKDKDAQNRYMELLDAKSRLSGKSA